jgi:Zn-dependent protease
MVLSIREIIDLILMTIIVGIIFSSFFRKFRPYEALNKYGIDWKTIKMAIWITAPAIILHEMAHKFVALSFGLEAVFHAAYMWLAIGFVLALLRTGFVFFVPGYVSIFGAQVAPIVYSTIAFAGPFMNLLLWFGAWIVLKKDNINSKFVPILILTKKINMLLFIFNMLPIPGFDGFQVYSGIIQTIF